MRTGNVFQPMDFSREPRLPAPPMVDGDITVDAPPDVPADPPANPLARLLPVAMLVAMGGMMAVYFTSTGGATRSPMFMFFPVMMLASVIGSLAYGTRGANHTAQLNEDRREYLGYLNVLEEAVAKTAVDQHWSLHWSHPDPEALWTLLGGPRMWERRVDDRWHEHADRRLARQRKIHGMWPVLNRQSAQRIRHRITPRLTPARLP